MSRSIEYGTSSGSGTIGGAVSVFADLPTPITDYVGTLYYVRQGSGGFLSAFGMYKYPVGFYTPNTGATAWEQVPLQVKVSEDSTTVVNITDWANFFAISYDISIGDILIYNNVQYRNKTGTQTSDSPDIDTTNWELAKTGYDPSTTLLTANTTQDAIDELLTEKTTYHGVVTLPTLTDNLDGTISIGSGIANYGTVADGDGVIVRSIIPETLNITLTDNTTNYVYADYNSGTPIVSVTLIPSLFLPDARLVPLYRVVREGTELHYLDYDAWGIGLADKMFNKDVALRGFERQAGLTLSTSPTRISTVSSGAVWFGTQLFNLAENVSGITGVLYEYYLVGGVWTSQVVTEYDSLYYSDGTDRQTLTNNRYVAKYFYRGVEEDNHVYYIHGNQYVALADALAEPIPTPPTVVTSHSIFVGEIIIQQGAADGVAYTRNWDGALVSSSVTSHADLSNIQQAGTGVLNGHISDGTQTIAGDKTFTGDLIIQDPTAGFNIQAEIKNTNSQSGDVVALGLTPSGVSNNWGFVGVKRNSATADIVMGVKFGGNVDLTDTKFTIQESGNVGINDSNPQNKLSVKGETTSTKSLVTIEDSASGDNLNGTASLYINNTGSTAGEASLKFKNSTSTTSAWFTGINQTIGNGGYSIARGTVFNSDNTKFIIDTDGNVGVGDVAPAYLLEVAGTTANVSGAWIVRSDERLKENISDVNNPLDKACKLADCVKHYNYKEGVTNNQELRTQYLAQLLEENGFAGHVDHTKPKNEAEGVLVGWEYADEDYIETKTETYTEIEVDEEGNEVEVKKTREIEVPKTRRIVTKEGDLIKRVENNFAPYAFPAIKALKEENDLLKERLKIIEETLSNL